MKRSSDPEYGDRLRVQLREFRSLAKIAVYEAFAAQPEPTASDVARAVAAALSRHAIMAGYSLAGLLTHLDQARRTADRSNRRLSDYVERQLEESTLEAVDAHLAAQPAVELPVRGFFVYVLWGGHDGQDVLYVGSSRNILNRLGSHLGSAEKRPLVTRVTVKEYPAEREMLEAEWMLIQHYSPPFNTAGIARDAVA